MFLHFFGLGETEEAKGICIAIFESIPMKKYGKIFDVMVKLRNVKVQKQHIQLKMTIVGVHMVNAWIEGTRNNKH